MEPIFKVNRHLFYPDSSIGDITINDIFECNSLEPTDRRIEIPGTIKIPNKTAIPRGIWGLTIEESPHFGRLMPHIINIPGFTFVMIHWGNTSVNTDACILTGEKIEGDEVIESKIAFDIFYPKLEEALRVGRQWIQIS